MLEKQRASVGILVWSLAVAGCGGAGDGVSSEAQSVDSAGLIARPSSLDFGAVAVGASATQTAALINNSRDVMDITNLFPPDPCRAVVIQPCIRPGDSASLVVTCSPASSGAFSGRVAVHYHHGSESEVLYGSVSGRGAAR